MNKIADFIVKKRIIIITIILLITIGCAFLLPKVKVNYDLGKYLPEETDTSKGLEIMNEEFGLIGNVQVMVKNISKEQSLEVYNILLEIDGIKAITFDAEYESYYKDNKALYILTLDGDNYSDEVKETLENIEDNLKNYDISMGGGAVSAGMMNETLQEEIPYFVVIAVVLICVILLLISTSWIEPILFLSVSGIAILINYGTNIIFSEVSFITFAIAALLQLALSMDYSIMLLDQYHHELKDEKKEIAMSKALKKSFSTISSSSLTTIFGLLAMVFMSFAIGKDLGIVLAKGILINVIVVFLCLPALILLLDKLLNKTKKKAINLPVRFFTTIGIKGKYIITIIMFILLIGSYFIQSNLKLDYSYNFNDSGMEEIMNEFGRSNQIVLLYNNTADSDRINDIIEFLNVYEINGNKVLNNVVDYYNTSGIKLNNLDISQTMGLNEELIQNIFSIYSSATGIPVSEIRLNDFINFITQNLASDPVYSSYFDEQTIQLLTVVSTQLKESERLLVTNKYNRMIINVNLAVEGEETYQFFDDLKKITKDNLDESYLLGETALASDIKDSFGNELLIITILTIISMIIIIALTFKSISIPIILVALIQGAIWISLSIPAIMDKSLFFMALIIAQCIQMGATIDYAILLSSKYITNREKQSKKEALSNALKASIMTIFTSASILVIATFTIAIVSSQELISTICIVIGRGTIISTIIVLLVLPACLILFDKFIEKGTYKLKFKK